MASRIITSAARSGLRLGRSSYPALRRSIVQSAALRHKETQSQNPDIDEQIDRLKRELLERQAKGEAEWKPELASDSEEAIHAEREYQTTLKGEAAIKELQELTKRSAKRETQDQRESQRQ